MDLYIIQITDDVKKAFDENKIRFDKKISTKTLLPMHRDFDIRDAMKMSFVEEHEERIVNAVRYWLKTMYPEHDYDNTYATYYIRIAVAGIILKDAKQNFSCDIPKIESIKRDLNNPDIQLHTRNYYKDMLSLEKKRMGYYLYRLKIATTRRLEAKALLTMHELFEDPNVSGTPYPYMSEDPMKMLFPKAWYDKVKAYMINSPSMPFVREIIPRDQEPRDEEPNFLYR